MHMFKGTFLLFLLGLLPVTTVASPKIVQSLTVEFPLNGRVIVQAKEEIGKFPAMVFISEKSGKVLLAHSVKDPNKWLIPDDNKDIKQPNLRFRVIRSNGFSSPLIMSIGAWYGGSDNAFFLTIFGEMQGQIKNLVVEPIFVNIQGGYYLGYISKKWGYGLIARNFMWNNYEAHYSKHKYEADIFKLDMGKFHRVLHRISKRKYGSNGVQSLREIGIYVHDQRTGVPIIKDSLD